MFIEISDAVESYGSGETKVFALDRVQLSLDEGKFYVILKEHSAEYAWRT